MLCKTSYHEKTSNVFLSHVCDPVNIGFGTWVLSDLAFKPNTELETKLLR